MSGYHCWNVDNLYRWPKAPQSCYLRWAQEDMCTKLSVSRWRAKEPRAAPFMQHWHFHLSSFHSMRTHFSESNSSYYVLILAINQTAFFKTNYIKHISRYHCWNVDNLFRWPKAAIFGGRWKICALNRLFLDGEQRNPAGLSLQCNITSISVLFPPSILPGISLSS